jgi:hypothetical protein
MAQSGTVERPAVAVRKKGWYNKTIHRNAQAESMLFGSMIFRFITRCKSLLYHFYIIHVRSFCRYVGGIPPLDHGGRV